MLRFLLVPLVALSLHLPVAGQADEASEIAAVKAAIDSLDQAFISGDASAIKALVTPEHIAIGPTYDGPVSIDEQLGFFGRIVLAEWNRTTEPEVTLLSDAVAMSTRLAFRSTAPWMARGCIRAPTQRKSGSNATASGCSTSIKRPHSTSSEVEAPGSVSSDGRLPPPQVA